MVDYHWDGSRVVKSCPTMIRIVGWAGIIIATFSLMSAVPLSIVVVFTHKFPYMAIGKQFVSWPKDYWIYSTIPPVTLFLFVVSFVLLQGRMWAYYLALLSWMTGAFFSIRFMIQTLTDNHSGAYVDITFIFLIFLITGFSDYRGFVRQLRKRSRRVRVHQ